MEERQRVALLGVIVIAYIAFGAAYAVRTPTWENPDEPAHFNYVRHIAETGQFPTLQVGDYDQSYLEELKAKKFPPAMPVDSVRYESWQPPLYYLLASPLYLASSGMPQSQQVIVLRLFSVLLGAILLVVSYGVARCLFPKDDLLSLAVPGFIAVLPQHVAMTASVSNDTLAEVALSTILLVLVRGMVGGAKGPSPSPSPKWRGNRLSSETTASIVLGVLLGIALLTKTTIYVGAAVIPLGLLLRQYHASRHRGKGDGRNLSLFQSLGIGVVVRQSAVVFAIAAAIGGWWFFRNALVYGDLDIFAWRRHDLVVQGQPLMAAFDLGHAKFLATWTFKSFWAQFGWMGVLADERTYVLVGVLTAVATAGLTLFILRAARQPASLLSAQWLGLLLLSATLVMVTAVFVTYNFRFIQPQGRYLFPAIIPIAVFFTLGLREIVAERYAALFFAILYLAMLALDYIALTRFILPQLAG